MLFLPIFLAIIGGLSYSPIEASYCWELGNRLRFLPFPLHVFSFPLMERLISRGWTHHLVTGIAGSSSCLSPNPWVTKYLSDLTLGLYWKRWGFSFSGNSNYLFIQERGKRREQGGIQRELTADRWNHEFLETRSKAYNGWLYLAVTCAAVLAWEITTCSQELCHTSIRNHLWILSSWEV